MELPTFKEIEKLHKKHAPSQKVFNNVWTHSQIVRDIALQLAANWRPTNKKLIEVGALLHDIGVYRLYRDGVQNKDAYVTHGLLGYKLLEEEGFGEAICRFALRHTGVGITKEDIVIAKLPLPPDDYVAETNEERLVMYADKFHSKNANGSTFNSVAWYTNYLRDTFGEHKARLFKDMVQEFGEPDLTSLTSRYNQTVR